MPPFPCEIVAEKPTEITGMAFYDIPRTLSKGLVHVAVSIISI
jgi:hypothetical protein